MTLKGNQKKFDCKNEDLPVIGSYLLTSVQRDANEFSAYSPVYNEDGIFRFEEQVNEVDLLVNPQTETNEIKIITGQLYGAMDSITEKARHIEGYIVMAKTTIPISIKDFGITALKQRARARDTEGVLQNTKLVIANAEKYKNELKAQGLTEEFVKSFSETGTQIAQLNRKQYETVNRRKATVHENINILNSLYDTISEICRIGKILFANNPEKLDEYTFSKLKKRVRNTGSSN